MTIPKPHFDLSTLRENCLLDKESTFRVQHQLSVIDDKIADLLREKAFNKALLAPIRRIPPEVLGEIFKCCLEADWISCSSFQTNLAPLLLTRVCHTWREVALGTPRLWTTIKIFSLHNSPWFLKTWMQNTGSLGLDITLHFDPKHTERAAGTNDSLAFHDGNRTSKFTEMIGYIFGRQQAIHSISLRMHPEMIKELMMKVAGRSSGLAFLENLELKNWSFPRSGPVTGVEDLDVPQLNTLIFDHTAFPLTAIKPSSSLRYLRLTQQFPVRVLVNFLKICPGIEEIVAEWSFKDIPMPTSPSLTILDSLRVLRIARFPTDESEDGSLFCFIRAPNLQELRVAGYITGDVHALSAFIESAKSSLRSLALYSESIISDVFVRAILSLVAIEDVDLKHTRLNGDAWRQMTPAEGASPTSWIWPKLRRIKRTPSKIEAPDEAAFVTFIARRSRPSAVRGVDDAVYLEKVEIFDNDFQDGTWRALKSLMETRRNLNIVGIPERFNASPGRGRRGGDPAGLA